MQHQAFPFQKILYLDTKNGKSEKNFALQDYCAFHCSWVSFNNSSRRRLFIAFFRHFLFLKDN